jgi:hypothetical protein
VNRLVAISVLNAEMVVKDISNDREEINMGVFGFIIGMVIGSGIGIFITSLCFASKMADEQSAQDCDGIHCRYAKEEEESKE